MVTVGTYELYNSIFEENFKKIVRFKTDDRMYAEAYREGFQEASAVYMNTILDLQDIIAAKTPIVIETKAGGLR